MNPAESDEVQYRKQESDPSSVNTQSGLNIILQSLQSPEEANHIFHEATSALPGTDDGDERLRPYSPAAHRQ